MKQNIQVGILVAFGVIIAIAIFVFAGFIPSPLSQQNAQTTGHLQIWGTIPSNAVGELLRQKVTAVYTNLQVQYIQKTPETFSEDLINALADGKGPDLLFITGDMVARFANKIEPVPTALYSQLQFEQNFTDGGNIFITYDKKILALPIWADPMVMYWNKSMFANGNVARPPQYWDELLQLAPILTQKNDRNDIQKSAVALGNFQNISNAKDILATLMIQTGNPMIQATDLGLVATFDGAQEKYPPMDTSLRFFTDFADPLKPIYSWNNSLPEAKSDFVAEDLAMYFGYASEISGVRTKNPNMNFGVASIPQIRGSAYRSTLAKIGGIAVMKASVQKSQAFFIAQLLASPDLSGSLSQGLALPPARRDLLSVVQNDPSMQMFYQSALVGKTWLDPSAAKTTEILKNAVNDILSGRSTIEDARTTAQTQFSALISQLPI